MANPNALIAEASGLQTQPNELTLPAGALAVAENVEITRDGIIEVARGHEDFSDNLPNFRPEQLLVVGDVAYAHVDNGLWYHDGTRWLRKTGNMGSVAGARGLWIENGYLYIAGNHCVTAINLSTGVKRVIAGRAGSTGSTNGTGDTARFNQPQGIWGDGAGNLYVVDIVNGKIRKVTTAGVVTDFVTLNNTIIGIWGDGTNLYVTDNTFGLRKVVIATATASVLTAWGYTGIWGDAQEGYLYVTSAGFDGGRIDKVSLADFSSTNLATNISGINGVAGDGAGNVYFGTASKVMHYDIQGGTFTDIAGSTAGLVDGIGAAAKFNTMYFMVWDDDETLTIGDQSSAVLRKMYLDTNYVMTLTSSLGKTSSFVDSFIVGPD